MINKYLAKSYPKCKTINEHTEDLLKLFIKLKNRYPDILEKQEWDLLETAIIHHDVGKLNAVFQNKLYSSLKINEQLPDVYQGKFEIPHGWLSTCMLDYEKIRCKYGFSSEQLKILAMVIYYHHHRQHEYEDIQLAQMLSYNTTPYIQQFNNLFKYGLLSDEPDFEHINTKVNLDRLTKNIKQYTMFIKIKGLLNRIDYIASAEISEIEKDPYDNNNGSVDAKVLKKYTTGNNKLASVQEYLLANRNKNIILTASTGIGKTEGALLWLGNQKGFYTLPLRVSINAIYNRIKGSSEVNSLNYSPVAILHSDSQKQYLLETNSYEESIYMNSEARLFNAPLTITTVDQIFRFVFRYPGYEMIPATLMYSKVIIDEIQMYTPSIIACILYGLREIYKLGGKFLIMTATMPKIFIKILKENLKLDVTDAYEIPEPFLRESNRTDKAKHYVKLLHTSIDIENIEKEALNNKVLVIVNTVAKAQEIYERINIDNKWLIHSLYTREHRSILENAIMEFSKDPKAKGVWISTQIVEASLDIDFDILHTEMCTIDSLFQRMGRILRGINRFLENLQPNIKVYTKEETGVGYVIDPEIYQFSLDGLKKALGPEEQLILTEEDKQEIIRNVYDPETNLDILQSNYYKSITKYIDEYLKSIQTKPYELKKSEILFRDIMSELVIPRSIYDELDRNGELLRMEQEFQKSDLRQKTYDEILKYTIQVSHFYDGSLLYSSGSELLTEAGMKAYSKNGIKICECPYDFDVNEKKGLGLKKKISVEEKNKIQTSNSII